MVSAIFKLLDAAGETLTAEMADSSHQAKTLVIKAEDARILGDVKAMRSAYSELYTLNAELIDKADKRGHYLPLIPPVTSVTVLPTEGNPPTGSNSGTEVTPPLGVDETPNGQAAS